MLAHDSTSDTLMQEVIMIDFEKIHITALPSDEQFAKGFQFLTSLEAVNMTATEFGSPLRPLTLYPNYYEEAGLKPPAFVILPIEPVKVEVYDLIFDNGDKEIKIDEYAVNESFALDTITLNSSYVRRATMEGQRTPRGFVEHQPVLTRRVFKLAETSFNSIQLAIVR